MFPEKAGRKASELPISPELFAQIRQIEIRASHLVTEALAGHYESAFRGRGMEFDEVRAYRPGDDVRTIDWNVTARMQEPHVKRFQEERELTVMLLIDASSSGLFGSGERSKSEVMAEVAAILALTALRSNDKVGLIVFSDDIEETIPAKKGRGHAWRVIRSILAHSAQHAAGSASTRESRGTNIARALDHLARIRKTKSVAFLISDFLDELDDKSLRIAARRHQLAAIRVVDPREIELPNAGLIQLQDAETGEILLVDTSSEHVRRDYARQMREHTQKVEKAFLSAGVDEIVVPTDGSSIAPIARFFRARERSVGMQRRHTERIA